MMTERKSYQVDRNDLRKIESWIDRNNYHDQIYLKENLAFQTFSFTLLANGGKSNERYTHHITIAFHDEQVESMFYLTWANVLTQTTEILDHRIKLVGR